MAGASRSGDQSLTLLPSTTITTAVTGQASAAVIPRQGFTSLVLQAVFTYGSGGTTAKAWVQTSFDRGTTWVDIATFAFLLASATKISAVKSAIAVAAAYVPTDGTLADDTIKDGLLGDRLRVKYTSTGTYGTNTTLAVTAVAKA
ncbi:MAG TPA: hypothetical protein VF951_03995 [Streptosporangiaceae bacterium]